PSTCIEKPIIYMPLVATYNGNWLGQNWFNEERSTTLDVATTLGLRGLLHNSDNAFNDKQPGASANYLALRTGLQHTETFARWSLYGKLDMQLASGTLVPTEQFIAGGAESVRGYLEGERAGDAGVRATVELRTPQFNPGGVNSPWRLWGLTFFDTAILTTKQASQTVPPQPDSHRLRSVGLGFRLNAPHGLSLEVDAARALVDGADGDFSRYYRNYATHAGDKRIHARTVWGF
ncbi:MAG: BamA/TamA family outer membrane protein, partial [Nevskiales bacterium]